MSDDPNQPPRPTRKSPNSRRRQNPVGKLGGEPMDGIDYISDELAELKLHVRMDYDWTPEAEVRDDAIAEQIVAACVEAEAYDCGRTNPRFFGMKRLDVVRAKLGSVVDALPPSSEWHVPMVPLRAKRDGTPCAGGGLPNYWDSENPYSYVGLTGILAGFPPEVWVLQAGFTARRWLSELQERPHTCAWRASGCLDYTRIS